MFYACIFNRSIKVQLSCNLANPEIKRKIQGLKKLRGAEDFDEFCKNVIENFLKIEETFYLIFPFYAS